MLSKAKNWWRERRERIAEKKAAQIHSEHGHGKFFLLTVPATATILAAVVEWYWAMLFCIEATGRIDWNFETELASTAAAVGAWDFAFSAHIPVLIGLVCATIPIVMLSMVWLPVQFTMRGAGRWRRGSVIAVGVLANILVIVSGTVVMNYSRQDQVRDALVVEQQAGQDRAALIARRDQVQGRLNALTDPSNNSFQAQAARAGPEGWAVYVETAEQQLREGLTSRGRVALIQSARGSAVTARNYQEEIDRLTDEIAMAPTEAAVAMNVDDTVGRELNTFAQYVEVWRPPFVAVICTLIGIFGAWWTLALMQGLNPRDVLRSGWADESHRIEDHSEEAPIEVDPRGMQPAREVVTDAETGEELVKVKPKEYWRRRVPKKGKPTKVEIEPEILPDETGVAEDGGNRTARGPITAAGPLGLEIENANVSAGNGGEVETERGDERPEIPSDIADAPAELDVGQAPVAMDDDVQPDSPSEAAIDAYMALSDAPVEAGDVDENTSDSAEPDQGEQYDLPDGEGVMVAQDEPEREPETDPGKLIAAE